MRTTTVSARDLGGTAPYYKALIEKADKRFEAWLEDQK